MRNYCLLMILLANGVAVFGLASCSCRNPEFIHLDFADDLSIVGPTMGERAAGHAKVDSTVRSRELFFLVNESDPKCYSEEVIERFVDTCKFVRREIAMRYHELRVTFYHRSVNTDFMLHTRTDKALTLCYNDIISEVVWRDGRRAK